MLKKMQNWCIRRNSWKEEKTEKNCQKKIQKIRKVSKARKVWKWNTKITRKWGKYKLGQCPIFRATMFHWCWSPPWDFFRFRCLVTKAHQPPMWVTLSQKISLKHLVQNRIVLVGAQVDRRRDASPAELFRPSACWWPPHMSRWSSH